MISYVKGTLTAIEEDRIVVETGGIGYGIRVPLSLLEELPALGTERMRVRWKMCMNPIF